MFKAIGPIDNEDSSPKYMRVQRVLREAVTSQAIAPQEAIPNERDLAQGFGVSRITVRRAISGLVEEGLLHRRQGAGTFVAGGTGRIEKSSSKISSFSEDMLARGLQPRSEWIGKTTGTVTPEESLNMGLSPGTAVYRFSRIRYADDMPMALEYSTINGTCLPAVEAVGHSLYEALAANGARPRRALQRLRAIVFDEDRAQMLGVSPGAPGLLIERRGYLKDGRLIELTTSYYRGDAYDFVAELFD